jgi:hypothetical protein
VSVVGSQHVKSDQIDYAFFPGERLRFLQVFNRFLIVVLNFMQSVFMSTIALSNKIRHRLDLKKDQIRHRLTDVVKKVVDHSIFDWHLRHAKEVALGVSSMILRF